MKLDGLKFRNGLAKLRSLFGILDSVIQCPTGQADHLRPDPNTTFIQCFDGDLIAFTHFSQNVFSWYLTVRQDQLTSAAGTYAQLVLFFADRKSWRIPFNNKCGYAPVTLIGIDRCKQDEEICLKGIRDPKFLPMEDIMVAMKLSPGLKRKGITTGSGL